MIRYIFTLFAFISFLGSVTTASAQDAVWPEQTYYRTIDVDGYNIFYREAGDPANPTRQEFFKKAHENRSSEMHQKLYEFTGLVGIKDKQYLRDVKGKEEIMSPDNWTYDLHFLENDTQRLIQIQLLQDYYNNLLAYPRWQQYLRDHKPPTLIVWGDNDPAFITTGGKAFLRDVPNAEFHLLDAGHFAMEEKPVEIAKHITRFLQKHNR